jgi:hypothetical protein
VNRSRTHVPALAVAAIAAPARPAQRETRDVQEPRSDLTIDTPGAAAA